MKIAIIYYSNHHFNTMKVVNSLAKSFEITVIDTDDTDTENLEEYDIIGFASGIYNSSFHRSVIDFLTKNLPENKKVFFLYTCSTKRKGYTKTITKAALDKNAEIIGEHGCLGFGTYGGNKFLGGIAKGHPDGMDIMEANRFFKSIISK